jgi:hypothetical protein
VHCRDWQYCPTITRSGAAAFSASMLALILTLVVACTTNPDTHRTSFNPMPVAEEREMGQFFTPWAPPR